MAIVEQVQTEIASVSVNDEYRVELTQVRKVTDYSPAQAMQLAAELVNAADEAERLIAEHIEQTAARMRESVVL